MKKVSKIKVMVSICYGGKSQKIKKKGVICYAKKKSIFTWQKKYKKVYRKF